MHEHRRRLQRVFAPDQPNQFQEAVALRCANGRLAIRSTPVVDRLLEITGLLDQLPLLPEDPAPAS